MFLSLNTIKPAPGSTKKRKRIGRGNSSGHGTYSTRGMKGQKSRSGGSKGLKRLGIKNITLNIPKSRGFKSLRAKNQVINLGELSKHFKDGDRVDPTALLRRGLVNDKTKTIKILGQGELKVKKLNFSQVKISDKAKIQILAQDGTIS